MIIIIIIKTTTTTNQHHWKTPLCFTKIKVNEFNIVHERYTIFFFYMNDCHVNEFMEVSITAESQNIDLNENI